MNVIWFRSDLRTSDNPALNAALRHDAAVAVYVLCEKQWDEHQVAPVKRDLIVRQLFSLERSLAKLNVPLVVLNSGTFDQAAAELPQFIQQLTEGRCIGVYYNHEYEFNEYHCTQNVISGLTALGMKTFGFHDQCAVAPGDIRTGNREYYKVFTPFKKAYIRDFASKGRVLTPEPAPVSPVSVVSDLSALHSVSTDNRLRTLWPEGEEEAHDRLNHFIEEKLSSYDKQRDFPSLESTSSLSPYLAVGALSTRQCLQAAVSQNDGVLAGGKPGADCWISEIIWRDFYRHLIFAFPHLCQGKPFIRDTDSLPWKKKKALFEAWKQGRTGYPIVDAAMRQLKETGWMHNRLRMVTAMFLTKHLFVDWRLGEAYFMQQLVDGDFASNNGGWQWSASTGVDAAPYFRIFSPVRQSERFDPDGAFIRRYVPELASLDKKAIHAPAARLADHLGYPAPLVDHKTATETTKRLFRELGERRDSFSEQGKVA